jgi:AraC-like DNA-binding protein/mannose-6-phosphate isomerase-like protein (cupin superfamily)
LTRAKGAGLQRLHERLDEDAINEVLASLRVTSTIYCRSDLRAPWGFAIQARPVAAFHLVTSGAGWLEVDGVDEPVKVAAGDLVLLLTGRAHRMRDDPSSGFEWLDDILEKTPVENAHMLYGGAGDLTELICGGFLLEGAQANPLLLAMPPILRVGDGDGEGSDWRHALLALLRAEVAEPRPGTETILARLADIMVTQAIRSYLVSLAHVDRPQVAALRDPRIAKAIRLIHATPEHPWTVEDLASEVAMSRSAFASRFRQMTGESPMRYVIRCRLARATAYLAEEGSTVSEVARRTGYESEASFNRAFSRTFGVAPGAYRKLLRDPSAAAPAGALPEMLLDA